MAVKKNKGFMVTTPLLPWLIVIVFAIILVVALLAIVKTASVVSSDSNRVSSNALQSMLDSNDCTPKTKIPLSDVLAAAIAEGKTDWEDTVELNYSGTQEGEDIVAGPVTLTIPVIIADCILRFQDLGFFGTPESFFYFYVGYSGCPGGKCFEHTRWCSDYSRPATCRVGPFSTAPAGAESSEYIALLNGDVARVVLKTR